MNNNEWRVERAKEVVKLLHTGIIDDNNEVREFNILDYYKIIGISPKSLYERTYDELRKEYSESELKKFYSFVLRSIGDPKITEKAIMEVKHSVLINDKLVEITDFDKTNIINYLKSNKIRLTSDVYALALKDYINNGFSFKNNLDKKNKALTK